MIKALIFGANSFSGRHLATRLADIPDVQVFGTDITAEAGPFDKYAIVDIGNREQVDRIVNEVQPNWVFNLVGLVNGSAKDIYQTNVMGTVNLLESVMALVPAAGVLLVGSSAEYGPVTNENLPVTEEQECKPVGAYGTSKLAATIIGQSYTRQYNLKIVIARPFNIIGAGIPERLVLGAILNRAKKELTIPREPVVKVGNLESQRDFVDVADVVEAYIAMLQSENWGEVFNLCSGKPYPVSGVVEMALAKSPQAIKIEIDPALSRPVDLPVLYGSYKKASKAFGFRPKISIEESVSAAWNHVMEKLE
jgi:GDP-4-dehydro-6-deoxy-D-mannose reductase